MEKRGFGLMVVAIVAGVGVAMLGVSGVFAAGGISDSAHDFSGDPWSTGKICLPCHTPHNADVSNPNLPLWNHETTQSNFTLYDSPTLDATMGQPAGASLACLSCHDGTVALDAFGGAGGQDFIGGSANLGIDISNDHPISFTYDAALAGVDGELVIPQSADTVDGTLPLFGANMECATCHDVHNNGLGNNLLIVSNAASALCLDCHVK